jgi:hypothetical protein
MSVLGNSVTQQSFTPAVDVYSGNGSTVAFTLSRPVASVAQVEAFIENVPQSPVDAFTVNGNIITFTSAPPSGSSNIYVRYTSPITQVIAPTDGTIGTSALVNGAVTSEKMASGAAVSNIGAGGIADTQLATAVKPLGVGQTWTNVTGSRASGTTYTNTTGRPITVRIQGSSTVNTGVSATVNSVAIGHGTYATAGQQSITEYLVPAGQTYASSSAGGISSWFELR